MNLENKILNCFNIANKWEQFTPKMRQAVFAAYRKGERGALTEIRRFKNGAIYYKFVSKDVTWRDSSGEVIKMNRYGVC